MDFLVKKLLFKITTPHFKKTFYANFTLQMGLIMVFCCCFYGNSFNDIFVNCFGSHGFEFESMACDKHQKKSLHAILIMTSINDGIFIISFSSAQKPSSILFQQS